MAEGGTNLPYSVADEYKQIGIQWFCTLVQEEKENLLEIQTEHLLGDSNSKWPLIKENSEKKNTIV